MNCARREQQLLELAHGALGGLRRASTLRHLRHCRTCQARYALLRRSSLALAAEVRRPSALPGWRLPSPDPALPALAAGSEATRPLLLTRGSLAVLVGILAAASALGAAGWQGYRFLTDQPLQGLYRPTGTDCPTTPSPADASRVEAITRLHEAEAARDKLRQR